MSTTAILLVASLLSSGLMAGFFFAWAVSVIPGTTIIDDRSYIVTMQSINRKILNPWFILPFLATPLLLVAVAVVAFRAGQSRRGTTLVAAAVTYVFGVLAVTVGGNVPLNNSLDAFELSAAGTDAIRSKRVAYETPWNRWHNLRTLASVAALGLTALACTVTDGE